MNCWLVHRYPVKIWEKGPLYLRYYITSNCPVLQSVKKFTNYAPQKNYLKNIGNVKHYHNNDFNNSNNRDRLCDSSLINVENIITTNSNFNTQNKMLLQELV
jgi:hypothetical protein